MRTRASVAIDPAACLNFLIFDIVADRLLVPPDGRNEVYPAPLWPRKLRSLRSTFCAIQIELFPFRYPITSATAGFARTTASCGTSA
jgi:hypothetical protein